MSEQEEALKRVENKIQNNCEIDDFEIFNDIDALKRELTESDLAKKALELLVKKQVNLHELIGEFNWEDGLETYNNQHKENPLTQKEFDFLRVVIESIQKYLKEKGENYGS